MPDLGFSCHSPLKELGLLGVMADSRTGAGNMQDKPRASCNARKQVLKQKQKQNPPQ